MRSDEELMVAYVAGEQAAFDALFDRYSGRILGIMRRQIKQSEDAHELVQQTFLQLHRARRDFDPRRSLRPWLMTIAYNLRREYFRRRARRPEAPLEYAPQLKAEPQPDRLELAERALRIRQAVAQLPEGQRTVIAMHWFDRLSFGEVATALGLSHSAVKVRAHRGYKRLRQLLEEDKAVT